MIKTLSGHQEVNLWNQIVAQKTAKEYVSQMKSV